MLLDEKVTGDIIKSSSDLCAGLQLKKSQVVEVKFFHSSSDLLVVQIQFFSIEKNRDYKSSIHYDKCY
jgi:hypothetical protein